MSIYYVVRDNPPSVSAHVVREHGGYVVVGDAVYGRTERHLVGATAFGRLADAMEAAARAKDTAECEERARHEDAMRRIEREVGLTGLQEVTRYVRDVAMMRLRDQESLRGRGSIGWSEERMEHWRAAIESAEANIAKLEGVCDLKSGYAG